MKFRIEFSIDHTLGLSVAVETRRAIDAVVLPELDSPDDPLAETRLRLRVIGDSRLVALASNNHLLTETEPAWPVFCREVNAFIQE